MGLHQAADPGGRSTVASPRRQTTPSGRAVPAERKSVAPAPLHHSAQLKPIAVNAELAVAVPCVRRQAMLLVPKAVTGVLEPQACRRPCAAPSKCVGNRKQQLPVLKPQIKIDKRLPSGAVLAAAMAFSGHSAH